MRLRFCLLACFIVLFAAAFGAASSTHAASEPKHIEIIATRSAFTPGEVTLKKGEPVVLVVKSADVAHGIRFRELGLDTKSGKGQSSELSFTPDKTGDFMGQCSVFCGSGHGSMKLTLHVVE